MSDRRAPEQDQPKDRTEELSLKTGTDPLELIEQCLASFPEGDARQKLLYKLRHSVTLSQAAHQQRPAVDPLERFGREIGKNEVGLAAAVRLGLSDGSRRRRLGMGGRRQGQRQRQRGEQEQDSKLRGHYHPFACKQNTGLYPLNPEISHPVVPPPRRDSLP